MENLESGHLGAGKCLIPLWLAVLAAVLSAGCGPVDRFRDAVGAGEPVKIVLTTGFSADEVFRLEDASCSKSEIMVYLATERSRYEAVYGPEIWNYAGKEGELEGRLKEKVLAEISQIKAMTLLANVRGIVLSSQEEETADKAAEAYFALMGEEERKILDVSLEVLEGMYRDYALADKVYREIIHDLNPEISDDEARTITVQHVLLRTATENADGTLTPLSEEEKRQKYDRAQEVLRAASEGEAFESLIEKYSDGSQGTLSFGKGETEAVFEEAAFNLANGEISGIVETSRGYEVIKCISTFNREETDRNKLKIAEKRKDEVFEQEYDAFVDSLARNLNEELWDSVTMPKGAWEEHAGFFDLYQEYFGRR